MKDVRIRDISPRLAFQAHPAPTGQKVELVDRLIDAGVPAIEVSSFVRKDLVPGLADAEDVFARVTRKAGVSLECCVGNLTGLMRAAEAGADAAWFMLSIDESFSKNNIGRSIDDSIEELARMQAYAESANIELGSYIVAAFGGPSGPCRTAMDVIVFVNKLLEIEVRRWIIADSFGYGSPKQVRDVFEAISTLAPEADVSLQIHDSRGLGLANIVGFLSTGFAQVDAALAGSGGHPAMQTAHVGGVCTEDLVQMLDLMEVESGIDLMALIETANWLSPLLGVTTGFVRTVGAVPLADAGRRASPPEFSWDRP